MIPAVMVLRQKKARYRKIKKEIFMPSGEVMVTCPHCQHRTSLPIAAVKRDNYHCSRCLEKIPMSSQRIAYSDQGNATSSRPKKSNRGYRR
jgi:hypothetical protein